MVPRLGVYFTALLSRLSRMRRSLPRSAVTSTSGTFRSSRSLCPTSVSCCESITLFTSGRSRNSESSSAPPLAAQALKLSRFSIMRCRRMPFSRRMAVTSRCAGSRSPTAPSMSSSVPSRRFASGVFSSCDIWRRKRFFSSSSSTKRVRSHSSCCPSCSRSVGPLMAMGVSN